MASRGSTKAKLARSARYKRFAPRSRDRASEEILHKAFIIYYNNATKYEWLLSTRPRLFDRIIQTSEWNQGNPARLWIVYCGFIDEERRPTGGTERRNGRKRRDELFSFWHILIQTTFSACLRIVKFVSSAYPAAGARWVEMERTRALRWKFSLQTSKQRESDGLNYETTKEQLLKQSIS